MSPRGVALVTGAARGIGRAIASRLAADGFVVAVNDTSRQSEELRNFALLLKTKGPASSMHVADVSKEKQVKGMIEDVVGEHGALDVILDGRQRGGPRQLWKRTAEVSAEDWDRTMSVNAWGTFLCYKYAGLQMITQGRGGRIIGACSVAGKQGIGEDWPYTASKFAVRGLTQSAALEFGQHGITVNAYAPGGIETEMMRSAGGGSAEGAEKIRQLYTEMSPLKRIGVPEDIANCVSFIASKESQFITGQTISVNGGIYFD
ncbi:NAD-binding protein [Roridomyces roridus]|uniref:NAD-binding protein n=1 Tax=Roridomyces roridus TaxID=1738132 RepID=A0AAD7FIB4_9AGAR|nr:NAD-binding protein [Roridomyces roridus]